MEFCSCLFHAQCQYNALSHYASRFSKFVALHRGFFFSGFSYVVRTATLNFRNKLRARVVKLLRKACYAGLRQLPVNTTKSRRLKVDTEIQNILFENNTLIISQAYLVLYMITSFELFDWNVIKELLIRLAIGLAIEFFFNTLSIFFNLHWYNVKTAGRHRYHDVDDIS